MNCSTPGLPVHHQLLEFTQTHIHWVSDAIQPSHPVVPFSSCPQSLPASESFPMSQLFTWGGQSIGVSASASVLQKNTQDWFPLGWTSWISLHSKGLSKVFSNTTVKKHQFFSAQLSLLHISHIHTWLLEKANIFTLLFHFHQEALYFFFTFCNKDGRICRSAYLRLLIFLLAILIPSCASSSPVFLMMYSA